MSQAAPQPAASYGLTELDLHSDGRVNRWEEKAGLASFYQYESVPTPAMPDSAEVARNDIVDLTGKMDKDGQLNWDVPPGKWTVLQHRLLAHRLQEPPRAADGQRVREWTR